MRGYGAGSYMLWALLAYGDKNMTTKTQSVIIHDFRFLRGPNLYAYKPVMKIIMDIGSYEHQPSDKFPGFVERITAVLPDLQKHECGLHKPGGFIERLQTGTYLGHIVEHITLELQTMVGFPVSYGRARSTKTPGVYTVVIAYQEEEPAKAAFDMALRLTLATMHDHPFDFLKEFENLQMVADRYRLGPSTAAIVQAARARRIPIIRLGEQDSLVQFGYGIHQKRIQASETSKTSQIAVELCQQKSLTSRMLRTVGVPVPHGQVVRSAEEACKVAQELGFPVVVKPEDGNQGKGVSVDLRNKREVTRAYKIARGYSEDVLVEQFIQGQDHRLLVVNGTMVAAARREPAHVIGDGVHTIEALVAEANKDPRRRDGHSGILSRIRLDDEAQLVLKQQQYTTQSIPSEGQKVLLRNNSNLSTGGTAVDVTDKVHPRNVQWAELAAQILAMDVAGLDIVCQDISRPLQEQGGAIVEVNAAPGLRMHLYPTQGQSRDVGGAIVDMLYPSGASARIPVIAVTGTNGKTTVTRLVAHIYETAHYNVGMTSTEGVYIGKERIMTGDSSGPRSAKAVLLHPRVEVAVLETARGGLLREGLAFDFCSVGIVTNVSADHLGQDGVDTLEDLVRVKQVIIESVADDGTAVLNADDSRVAEMAAVTKSRVIYFGLDPNNYVIAAHLAQGGSAVFVEAQKIFLATGNHRTELIELDRVGFTGGGKILFQVQNALAAVAGAWGAGLNPAIISRALTTFATDEEMVPGRFNRFEQEGIEVIVDYGHNAAAMKALSQAIRGLEKKRTSMILHLPGDRKNEDLVRTLEATLPFVDSYFLHDEQDLRGRKKNEVPKLLKQALPKEAKSEIATTHQDALQRAWATLRSGERLVIIADIVDETLGLVRKLPPAVSAASADERCSDPIGEQVLVHANLR